MSAHDMLSERIAKAPNEEEEQWEKSLIVGDDELDLLPLLLLFIITDATLTGGCLASGFFYAQTLLSKSIAEKSNARRPSPKF